MTGPASRTGEELPECGICSLAFQNHPLPKVVILLGGETSPPCTGCSPPAFLVSLHAFPYASGCEGSNPRHSSVPVSRTNLPPNESTDWCFGMTKKRGARSAQKSVLEKP